MGTRRVRAFVTTVALAGVCAAGLAACGSSPGDAVDAAKRKAGDAVDDVLASGIGAYAKGTWSCTNTSTEGRYEPQTEKTELRITADGRFAWTRYNEPMAGTWAVDGLKLKLSVPDYGDGEYWHTEYDYRADANPPTRLQGGSADRYSTQDLRIAELGKDKVRITQTNDGVAGGTNYSWDATCTRTSSDPGTLPDPEPDGET